MEYSEQSSGYISRGQIKKISENIKMYLQHPQPTSNRTEKCAKKPTKRTEIACLWHNGHSFSPAVTATSWSHFCRLTQGLYGTVCCEPLQAEVSALLYQAQEPVSHPVPQPAAPLLTAISCVTSNHCVRINAFISFLCRFELQTHRCDCSSTAVNSHNRTSAEKLVSLLSEVIGFSSWWTDSALKSWETSIMRGCGRVCAVPLPPVLLFQSLQTAASVVNHCKQ